VAGFGAIGDEATIRQLLHHTSGITDYTRTGNAWRDVMPLDLTPDQMMDLARKQPKEFEPGSKWAYNNSGYFLLGMVIEKVAGKSYADYIEQDLLAQTGLTDTRYGDDVRVLKRRAQGYRMSPMGVANDQMMSMTQPYAAGSLVSTVVDLVRWSEMLAAGKIVSTESYAAMITPGTLNDGSATDYGFGLTIGEVFEKTTISHSGGIHGFSSQLAHYVEDDVHIAVLVNCDFGSADPIERLIAKAVLGIAEVEVKDLPLTEEEIDLCTGKYMGAGMKALIRTDGESLSLAPEGQSVAQLKHQGELRFLGDEALDIAIEFDRETSPASFFYLKQGGSKVKFERVK
jgi:D-alanyl-D-alanine carboxypeptidase